MYNYIETTLHTVNRGRDDDATVVTRRAHDVKNSSAERHTSKYYDLYVLGFFAKPLDVRGNTTVSRPIKHADAMRYSYGNTYIISGAFRRYNAYGQCSTVREINVRRDGTRDDVFRRSCVIVIRM